MPDARIRVEPDLLRWAIRRSGNKVEDLLANFPSLSRWLAGEAYPSLGELEKFAKATRTPIGNFFLESPPEINLGLTDFRTIGNVDVSEPSPNLVDTLAICEQRQEWYREYAIENGFDVVPLVGSLAEQMPIREAAAELHHHVDYDAGDQGDPTLDDAWNRLAAAIEDAGVLVMKNGVVGNNTHRPLDPEEFRGFALADDLAPLIFVNGKDARAATVFTLAHELVHIGLGISSISNLSLDDRPLKSATRRDATEQWCSAVAAELLVPGEGLRRKFRPTDELQQEVRRLARTYRVSGFVVLRKLRDEGLIDWERWDQEHAAMKDAWSRLPTSGETGRGGDTYRTIGVRVGRTFARAIVVETKSGNTLYSDALRLLGLRSPEKLNAFAERIGVA